MPVISPPIVVEREVVERENDRPRTGQGGGGVLPPAYTGGGDNGPGDGSNDNNYVRRLNRARLTLLLALTSISVLFVTFTVIFALRHGSAVLDRRTGMYVHNWVRVTLPVRLLLVNTLVLLLSSVSIEMARRSVRREMALAPLRGIPGIALDDDGAGDGGGGTAWIAITVVLGLMFLGGQWLAWESLRAHGFHIDSGGASPFVYLLTAAHAVHLAGGILVLLYAGAIFMLRRTIEQRRIVVEVAGWYWHFMGVLWVYIFALLEFGR
jgi:cytochrome c oxidase subunit III